MASIYYAVLKEFKSQWEKKYVGRTFTPRNYHFKQLKDFFKPVEGFEESVDLADVCERIKIYLNNKFYDVCAHNISIFIKNYDSFIPPAPQIPRGTNVCRKCGMIFRINEPHQCSVIASNYRKDKPAIALNDLLPPKQ